MNTRRLVVLTALLTAMACGGDAPKPEATDPLAAERKGVADFKAKQQAFADSVLNTASSAKQVADNAGANFAVGSTKLRDSVAVLVGKLDCHTTARKTDPYLAGTVSFWVNISVIGSDVIKVHKSEWTSPAGVLVDACLNKAAAGWKFEPGYAPPKGYIVQVQFK